MPDITKADVLAIIQAVVALVVAFGLDLTDIQVGSIIALSSALAVTLPLADSNRRKGRVPLIMQREAQRDYEARREEYLASRADAAPKL